MRKILCVFLTLCIICTTVISSITKQVMGEDGVGIQLPDNIQMVMPSMDGGNSFLWYGFDDAVGTSVIDTKVAGPRLSINLSGTFKPDGGVVSGALEFNGTSDYIQINNDNVGSTGFLHGEYSAESVAFWFKPYKLTGTQMLYVQGGNLGGISIRLNGTNLESTVSTGAPNLMDTVDLSGRVNQWIHVVLTFDNGTAKLYVDGELKSTKATSSNKIPAAQRATSVGNCFTGANGFNDNSIQYYNGMMDELRIYSTAIIPKVAVQGFETLNSKNVTQGTLLSELGLPTAINAYLTASKMVSVPVTGWNSTPLYDPQIADIYVFTPVLSLPSYLNNSITPQLTITVTDGSTDTELNSAVLAVRQMLEAYNAGNDITAQGILTDINNAISNSNIVSVWKSAPIIQSATADAKGSVEGIVVLSKGTLTREVAVNITINKVGDITGPVSLQSAAKKNFYIRNNNGTADLACIVEQNLRTWDIVLGLADTNGVSFKLINSTKYLKVSGNGLIVGEVLTENDKEAATFYSSAALCDKPGWANVYAGAFESYYTYSDHNKYIKVLSNNTLTVETVNMSDASDKLNASFKKTGDHTDVMNGLRGAVYYPNYSYNAPQFWKYYDSAIIERDMKYANKLGINAFRIWVSYEYWLENPEHFKAAYDDFLTLADKYGIKVLTSLFEGCSYPQDDYKTDVIKSRDFSTSFSITSPSPAIYNNSSRWNEPKVFVDWFMNNYKNDLRHFAIEIYNEPWGDRQNLAKELTKYIVSKQGCVPISLGTAPGESITFEYSVEAGVDIIQYHDNFPGSATEFKNRGLNNIAFGNKANLPVYCTEVQWVGGPGNPNTSTYKNLAPTCEELMTTGKWAPFYWTLMVHPAYLPENRRFPLINGIFQEDGSVWSVDDVKAIAPELVSGLTELRGNTTSPYTQYYYTYTFSDNFIDKSAYKWTPVTGTWNASSESYKGSGKTFADLTKFSNFYAEIDVGTTSTAGLMFRMKDADNGYIALISGSELKLVKIIDGIQSVLASKTVTISSEYMLKITANGSSISVSVGGISVTVEDGSFDIGKIGLYADNQSTFDNLLIDVSQVLNIVPNAPPKPEVVRTTQGTVVSWKAVVDADTYNVYRSESREGNFTPVSSGISGTSFTDTTLQFGTTYYYLVKSKNSNGESTGSEVVTAFAPASGGPMVVMPEITDQNGILWYEFKEAYGAEFAQSSLSNALKSIEKSGNFAVLDGKYDGSFSFNGIDSYIKMNQDDTNQGILHQVYNKLTVSFWMCPFSLDGKQMLYKQGGDAAGISIRINNGKLQVGVVTGAITGGTSTQFLADDISLDSSYINKWTHVAVTFDEGKVNIYLDAVNVFEGTAKAASIPAANKSSTLGACLNINAFRDDIVGQYYYGMLDDVRIYNDVAIPELIPNNMDEAVSIVKDALSKIKGSNSLTSDDILNMVKNAVNNVEFITEIEGFVLTAATENKAGSITGNIIISLGDESEIIPFNIVIDKLKVSDPNLPDPVVPDEPDDPDPGYDGPKTGDSNVIIWAVLVTVSGTIVIRRTRKSLAK